MAIVLLKSKWYIVDLDSKHILTDRVYPGCWKAIDAEQERGRIANFTALRASHLLEHMGKPWTLET